MSPEDLSALHRSAFRGAGTGRPWGAEEFGRLLEDQHVFLCLAPEGEAGFALGRCAGGEAELLTLAVRPERRRIGFGRALLDAFAAEARARGAAEAFVEVAEGNLPAIGLYVSAGYSERGRRRDYYTLDDGSRADALVLAQVLHR
ncbi:MAG: N-acetyltransferase [Pseudomonadota bacterium]